MTERIDHAEEAAGTLRVIGYPASNEGCMTRALVHATLALVEEQRMANRIALAVAVRADLKLGGSATDLSDWLHDGGGVLGYFSTDEKEALGFA